MILLMNFSSLYAKDLNVKLSYQVYIKTKCSNIHKNASKINSEKSNLKCIYGTSMYMYTKETATATRTQKIGYKISAKIRA